MAQFNSKSSRVYCKLPVARLPKSVIIKQPGQIKSAPFKKAKTPKSAQPQKNENNPSHDSRLNEKSNKANQLKTTTNLNNVNKHMKIEETWDNSCTLESKLSKSFQKSYYVETVKLKIKNGKIGREKKGSVFLVAKNNKNDALLHLLSATIKDEEVELTKEETEIFVPGKGELRCNTLPETNAE